MSFVVRGREFEFERVAALEHPRCILFGEQPAQQAIKRDVPADALQVHTLGFRHCGKPVFQCPAERCRGRVGLGLHAATSMRRRSQAGTSARVRFDAICFHVMSPRVCPSRSACLMMSRSASPDVARSMIARIGVVTA